MGGVNGPDLAAGLDRATPNTATLLADEIERRAHGEITPGSPEGLTEALTRWAAILRTSVATTPGDDRGRELARALDDLGRLVERIDTGTTTIDVSFATRLARARLDVARYVAAPPETEAVVHDPTTEDEDGRCTEYPDLIDRHGARWVWAIGSEYRARHVLGGWKCRDGAYIRRVFGPVTEVPATAPAPEGEAGWSGVIPADRERLVGAVTSVLQRSTGSLVEDVASDLLDDLASGGYRIVLGWLPGEREEPTSTSQPRVVLLPQGGGG